MPEFEEDGYQGLWLPGTRLSGDAGVVVVVKRRFDVEVEEGLCRPADDTAPVRVTSESSNEEDPSRGYVTRAAEAPLEKPRVDVMVLGDAFAPDGKATSGFQVRVRVGDRLDRRLSILGPREARARKKGKAKKGKKGEPDTPAPITVTFTKPRSIAGLPLTYEYAYGGRAVFRVAGEDVRPPEPPQAESPEEVPQDTESGPEEAPLEAPAERPAPPDDEALSDGETLILSEDDLQTEDGEVDSASVGGDPGLTRKIPLEDLKPPGSMKPTVEEAEDEEGGEPEEVEDGHTRIPYPANPVGRGFCVTAEAEVVRGTPLPCIEDPDAPLTPGDLVRDLGMLNLTELAPAAGFGPYPSSWYPRAGFAGVMPEDVPAAEEARARALESYDEGDEGQAAARAIVEGSEIPVMRADWYQEAHPGMQLNGLMGDEDIQLENLTPAGDLQFCLPGRHPMATVDLGMGDGPGYVHLIPDMLTLDVGEPESPRVEIVWRGWASIGDPEDLGRLGAVAVRLETLEQAEWVARVRAGEEDPEPAGTTMPLDQPVPSGEEAEADYKESLEEAARDEPDLHEGPTLVIDRDAALGDGEQEP